MIRRFLILGTLLGAAAPAGAQGPQGEAVRTDRDGPLRIVARVSADTVQVGEPFTVGVVVVGTGGSGPAIPQLLEPGEDWEQLEVARIEAPESEDAGTRAYYRLVAWTPGRVALPVLRVEARSEPRRVVEVELPGPWVRTVLPAEAGAGALRLRGPRPALESGWPWWIWVLLAVLAAAVAARWWRRHRATAETERRDAADVPDPAERARDALVALRERAAAGKVSAGPFYDRLEEILRAYLAETRDWPVTLPVRSAAWTDRDSMRELHRHAVFSRFAGVPTDGKRLVSDADVSLDWLTKDAA